MTVLTPKEALPNPRERQRFHSERRTTLLPIGAIVVAVLLIVTIVL